MATCRVRNLLNCCKSSRKFVDVRPIHVFNCLLLKQSTNIVTLKYDTRNFSNILPVPYSNCNLSKRFKHSKKKSESAVDSDDDGVDDLDPQIQLLVNSSKNIKIKTFNSSSMRIDAVAKVGMGMSRNKVEVAFFESKIRINGQKLLKKGQQAQVGDEIDLILGPSPKNPKFIVVTRITILDAETTADGYKIKIMRDKSLTIEDYDKQQYSKSNTNTADSW